jgi:hypothetical protein
MCIQSLSGIMYQFGVSLLFDRWKNTSIELPMSESPLHHGGGCCLLYRERRHRRRAAEIGIHVTGSAIIVPDRLV